MIAPNSPQWFNTGLNWAYGIDGPSMPYAQFNPVLNHCGLLGAIICFANMYLTSSKKAFASSSEEKYPPFHPQYVQAPASLSKTCCEFFSDE